MPATSVAKGLARLRVAIPLRLHWRDLYTDADGNIIEVDKIWCSRSRWARLPESKDMGPSGWQIQEIGPMVVACKVIF